MRVISFSLIMGNKPWTSATIVLSSLVFYHSLKLFVYFRYCYLIMKFYIVIGILTFQCEYQCFFFLKSSDNFSGLKFLAIYAMCH